MIPDQLADTWVPVTVPWRLLVEGDVFLDRDLHPWIVETTPTPTPAGLLTVTARRGAQVLTADVDPAGEIAVLDPRLERDAMELARDVLGAQLIERRAAA